MKLAMPTSENIQLRRKTHSRKSATAVIKRLPMGLSTSGLILAASTKAPAQSFQRQSIPCSTGITRPKCATRIFRVSRLRLTLRKRTAISLDVDGLLEGGRCKSS
ncbi:hypothetical protein CGCVW01_v003413 [Colletotrichum viniferum]|nr:hypothetical protein CGCVW01_v003413 [Colletotrichum viniferum]